MPNTDTGNPRLIHCNRFDDERGYFAIQWSSDTLMKHGIPDSFIQCNQSFSKQYVLRGLHYQLKHPQAKLVQVISGTILDITVDIRPNSPAFGQHQRHMMSDQQSELLYVPEGFAHGFLVLSDTALIQYHTNVMYHPEDEYGIAWNDPDLAIDWGLKAQPILSAKDQKLPRFCDIPATHLPNYEPTNA